MERIDMLWEPVRVILMQIGEFFPRVLLAVVILIVGWLLAKALRFASVKALRAVNFNVLIGRLAFWGVLVFVVLVALDQLGLGDIIRQSFLIVLAAIALGLALAFGLGGQKRAAEWLERWSRQHESELDTKKRHALDRSVK